ncbi:hypothetical protein FF011L_03280 [Roseimaritima multifibrata]|uniref:Uncharacterized protein n=1 Tax=Roseimaritima multifibrata TaxID=1930274 RepID=A0A517M9N0_9BACT|nr:hypothetical protein FF011L_03280 [Roseimaritima multifibrata]
MLVTETNPYRAPDNFTGEPISRKSTTVVNQRSLFGAVILGSFGYIAPFLIQSCLGYPLNVSNYFFDVFGYVMSYHRSPSVYGCLQLGPSAFCAGVFGIAGYLGFPNKLSHRGARRYLLAGVLTCISGGAYLIVVTVQYFVWDSRTLLTGATEALAHFVAAVLPPVLFLVFPVLKVRTRNLLNA